MIARHRILDQDRICPGCVDITGLPISFREDLGWLVIRFRYPVRKQGVYETIYPDPPHFEWILKRDTDGPYRVSFRVLQEAQDSLIDMNSPAEWRSGAQLDHNFRSVTLILN